MVAMMMGLNKCTDRLAWSNLGDLGDCPLGRSAGKGGLDRQYIIFEQDSKDVVR